VSREGDVPALRQIKPCARLRVCSVIQAQVLGSSMVLHQIIDVASAIFNDTKSLTYSKIGMK